MGTLEYLGVETNKKSPTRPGVYKPMKSPTRPTARWHWYKRGLRVRSLLWLAFWISDSNWDFGFWIADFGLWIADIGFWIADFWILDC